MSLAITSTDFEREVLQSNVPVLVDFWAEWCGPCKSIGPTIDEVATEYNGRAKVYKCNVEDEPELTNKYAVMSIPMLLFFKGGKVVDQLVGLQPKPAITGKLDGLL